MRLFDIEPGFLRFTSPEDRALAREIQLPTQVLEPGELDLGALLEQSHAFAAYVIDGMVLQSLRVRDHTGLRLLGPGDIVSLTETARPMLVLDVAAQATAPTTVALLGRDFLLAARRWPWLVAGMQAQLAEQSERLMTQLLICQLPRVEERLLSLLWLLAESWGQVTMAGTVLPVELTHATLGGLIGARRPTVTLALRELTTRGDVLRQDRSWLLLREPEEPASAATESFDPPRLMDLDEDSGWARSEASVDVAPARDELFEAVTRLREQHERSTEQMRESLRRMTDLREENRHRRIVAREGAGRASAFDRLHHHDDAGDPAIRAGAERE
jgi:CRP-like cAMP-binding protein